MVLAPGVMSGRRSLVHRNDVAPTWNAPRECSRPSFAQQAVLTCPLPATKKKAREGGASLFENLGRILGYPRCHIGHMCGVDCSAAMVDLRVLVGTFIWHMCSSTALPLVRPFADVVAGALRAHVGRSSAWWVGNASHAFAIASSKGRERADPKP